MLATTLLKPLVYAGPAAPPAAGLVAATGLLDEVGVAAAGAGIPAARPTLGAADPLIGELLVVNCTCGTVTCVETTDVVDELGIVAPTELPAE